MVQLPAATRARPTPRGVANGAPAATSSRPQSGSGLASASSPVQAVPHRTTPARTPPRRAAWRERGDFRLDECCSRRTSKVAADPVRPGLTPENVGRGESPAVHAVFAVDVPPAGRGGPPRLRAPRRMKALARRRARPPRPEAPMRAPPGRTPRLHLLRRRRPRPHPCARGHDRPGDPLRAPTAVAVLLPETLNALRSATLEGARGLTRGGPTRRSGPSSSPCSETYRRPGRRAVLAPALKRGRRRAIYLKREDLNHTGAHKIKQRARPSRCWPSAWQAARGRRDRRRARPGHPPANRDRLRRCSTPRGAWSNV